MAIAYIVLLAMAALGVGLGWRMTPIRSERRPPQGIARLLQLTIALTVLLALILLALPWLRGLSAATCGEEVLREGKCVAGLREGALFGSAVFMLLLGVGIAYVVRRGVFDTPLLGPSSPTPGDDAEGDARPPLPVGAATDDRPDDPERASRPPAPEYETHPHSVPKTPVEPPAEPRPPVVDTDEPSETESDESDEPAAQTEQAGESSGAPETREREITGVKPWRRLQGPVFQAFVDDRVVGVDEAIRVAAQRLRSERIACVFSRGASKAANEALGELADHLGAYRYVLEGTAAATEGVPTTDKPDPHEADSIAGPDARHAGELALDLAGALIETVMLLDTRVAFPEFVLGKLTELQSVCIAHSHDSVSGACQVLLPGTNPGEREGELVAAEGVHNERRSRESLVRGILSALREAEALREAAEPPTSPPTSPEPQPEQP